MEESANARQAYADYVALGPERSLNTLLDLYRTRTGPAPTKHLTTLKQWSTTHGWQARLQALADQAAAQAEAEQAAYIRSIMETGFALSHERVKVLGEIAATLITELQGKKRWLREKRSIRVGTEPIYSDDGERVIGQTPLYETFDLERFNAAELEQLRGVFDDIAREKGDRVKRTELTGADKGPIEVVDNTPPEERAKMVAAIIAAASQRDV